MKRLIAIMLAVCLLAGCSAQESQPETQPTETSAPTEVTEPVAVPMEGTHIALSDDGVTVEGDADAVHTANDIVYYEAGQDFTYGEGSEADAHSAEEAAAHTVVHITKPGTYILSGSLSAGQVAVDLGDGAGEDPEAVVTLVLNGVDITCTVAPAVIFYNVYECGSKDTETATETVDTSAAGANVLLADGSVNNISGAYVARIYKPDSVVLSDDGTEVADAKKLHKYDAAFYSKMSMNVDGGGELNITASNEGLDSELHLTINGGKINITSGNDGINTNEDGVSVTTVNGGEVNITVSGETGEGDGIDSNGWLVINGGKVTAAACSVSGDAGIDSDMGIYLNGGTVLASGGMLDRIAGSEQNYAVFTFAGRQSGGTAYTLKNAEGNAILTHTPANDFSILIIAGPGLVAGEYTFWAGDTQLAASAGQGFGGMGFGGQMPEGMEMPEDFDPGQMGERPEPPEGETVPQGMDQMTPPEGMEFPEGEMPTMPEGEIPEMPEGEMPTMPEGEAPEMPGGGRGFGGRGQMGGQTIEVSEIFTITEAGNYFSNVTEFTE